MRTDNRLPRVLHVLLHLAHSNVPLTSEKIGNMLSTNPSLVRRTMAGLKKSGFVSSTKGHGGGWILERPLEQITLAQVYGALGSPKLFAIGHTNDAPKCLLEQAANNATTAALITAQECFNTQLANITVAELGGELAENIEKQKTRKLI